MATRNVKRTTTVRKAATKPKRRQSYVSSRKTTKSTSNFFSSLVPIVIILAILVGLGFLLFKGYQTVTASSFFDVKKVEIRGAVRVSKDEVEKIVRQKTERDGVWNAEIEQIKNEVEKLTFVKSAVVSRILPDGVMVKVEERNARAVVRIPKGDFWVDDDATTFAEFGKNEKPITILRGWDEDKTEKATKDNQHRVKLFLKAQEDIKNSEITKRIIVLNVTDLQDVQAVVEDSGETVNIFLGKEDFGKRMQSALSYIEGKGQTIDYIKSYGGSVAVGPRKAKLES